MGARYAPAERNRSRAPAPGLRVAAACHRGGKVGQRSCATRVVILRPPATPPRHLCQNRAVARVGTGVAPQHSGANAGQVLRGPLRAQGWRGYETTGCDVQEGQRPRAVHGVHGRRSWSRQEWGCWNSAGSSGAALKCQGPGPCFVLAEMGGKHFAPARRTWKDGRAKGGPRTAHGLQTASDVPPKPLRGQRVRLIGRLLDEAAFREHAGQFAAAHANHDALAQIERVAERCSALISGTRA